MTFTHFRPLGSQISNFFLLKFSFQNFALKNKNKSFFGVKANLALSIIDSDRLTKIRKCKNNSNLIKRKTDLKIIWRLICVDQCNFFCCSRKCYHIYFQFFLSEWNMIRTDSICNRNLYSCYWVLQLNVISHTGLKLQVLSKFTFTLLIALKLFSKKYNWTDAQFCK